MKGLLERDATLAQLRQLTCQAGRSGGRVVLVHGEAGSGKTALLAHHTAELGSSATVLRGWCDPLAAPRPFGPVIDALAGMDSAAVSSFAAAVVAGDSARIHRCLLVMLRGGGRWVWVIDDAQWADGATLDLVRFIARRIVSLPLLLVVSYRDDEIGVENPWAPTLDQLGTCKALSRIGLEPLSPQAVATLASGSGLNAERVHQLTGGNPFFVTEMVAPRPHARGREAVPRSVLEAVWGRLGRLSDPARETVYAAAVCGPRTTATLLELVTAGAAATLNECVRAGILVTAGDAVEFRHELTQHATLQRIPDFVRTAFHKRALTALAQPPIDPNTLATLAFHAERAGDADAALGYGIAAAEQAAALGANRESASSYALALRHAASVPAEQKATWLEGHGLTSYLSGEVDPAVASWRRAIVLRRSLGDQLHEGDDLRWLSHLLQPLGKSAEALEAARASLQVLEGVGPSPQLAWSLINMAHIAYLARDPMCAQYATRALALGNEFDDSAAVIRARGYLAITSVFSTDSGWDELKAVWREAMSTTGLEEHAGVLSVLICWSTVMRCDLDRADECLIEASLFCDEHDLGMFRDLLAAAATMAALHRGAWDHAALTAEQILSRPELSPQHRILPLVALALTRVRRGEQSSGALLDEAVACARSGDLSHVGIAWVARAEAAWLEGDDDRARIDAEAGLAWAVEHSDPWLAGHARRWIHLAGGPTEFVACDVSPTPFDLEISGCWHAAAEIWTQRGCSYDTALAQLGGDVAALESALATFRRLGARPAARRAKQRLATLRGHAPRGRGANTLADPLGLTGRQRAVLELLVAGRSDADIAATLHISRKTVGNHIQAILTTFGVDNRARVISHAIQHRITTITSEP